MRTPRASRLRSASFDSVAPAERGAHSLPASRTRRELLRGSVAVVLGLSVADLIAACTGPANVSPVPVAASTKPPLPPIPEVSLVVTETTFEPPQTLASGIVRVFLENKGGVPSTLAFFRLRDGTTVDRVMANFPKAGPELANVMQVFESFGGHDGVLPGERRGVVMELAAGTYVLSSRAAGGPTAGILRQLVVVPASGATMAEPTADVTVSLKDGVGPTVPAPVTTRTTWKVTNDGQLPHNFAIWRFKSGKTAPDLATFFATAGASGPVPAAVVAGCGLLSPGKHAWFTSDLEPGQYLDACTVPGHNPPANHLNEGEATAITVA